MIPVSEVHTTKPFDLKSISPERSEANRIFITVKGVIREVFGGRVITVNGVPTYALNLAVEKETSLGKLGLKAEPAGKIRVFAMVDPITQ